MFTQTEDFSDGSNNRPSVVVELELMNVLPKECKCGLKAGGEC